MVENEAKIKRITNDELEKLRLNLSRCANCDVAPIRVQESGVLRYNIVYEKNRLKK